jgi:class 3 adenylate cyclase/tetratricopeptide (TPR) repeat protein
MAEARKTVTVVFTDVAGSTSLGEGLDPETLRRVMERYFEEMSSVLERHGGTVEKFVGDAVVAVFGIPQLHEDDALRAVRAAAEMRERLEALNEDLEGERGVTLAVRTGVNTGEVVAGDPSGGQFYATGDAVNVAARLEQAAAPGEILLGGATHRLVRDAVRVEPVEPLHLKGKAEPVAAWRLLEALPDVPAFTRRLDSPFVGRGRELVAFRTALDEAARERACRLVTVLGPPGIGKSRLVREFVGAIGDDARAVVGRCLSYGEGITFWPLAEIVEQVAGRTPHAAVAELVGGEDGSVVAKRIAAALGLTESAGRVEETFWAVRKLFEALAREGPLVVVLDDVHWAEPTFLDLVEYLLAFAGAPILLVCIARPELLDERPAWGAPRPGATSVPLEPLSATESETLATALATDPGAVVEAAEGNPLFLEQLLAFRAEGGGNGGLETPPTIHALIAARIDRLSAPERAALERAAVEGRMFHLGTVAELLPEDSRSEAGASLFALVRKELIRPDRSLFPADDGFRFAHVLIREVAYGGMSKELRADLHESFAGRLESLTGGRIAELEEIIAYHLEQACRYQAELGSADELLARRAGERVAQAGRRALTRGDMPAAINLLERARALWAPGGVDQYLMPDLFDAYFEAGRLGDAEALVNEALRAGEGRGETILVVANLLRAQLKFQTEPTEWSDRALTDAERAIAVFEERRDDRMLARAWNLAEAVLFMRGALTEAREAAEQGLVYAQRVGDVLAQASLLMEIGGAVAFGPTPYDECEGVIRQQLAWAREAGILWLEATALTALGQISVAQGRVADGRALIDEGRTTLADLSMVIQQAGMTMIVAEYLHDEPEAIERDLRTAYRTLSGAGERGYLSTAAADLAGAVLTLGREDEALRLVDEAEQAGARDDIVTQVSVQRVRARVLARRGDEDAKRIVRAAVERAAATEYMELHASALADQGEVLALLGQPGEAVRAFEQAIRLFERKGDVFLAGRTRARRAELQAGSPSQ